MRLAAYALAASGFSTPPGCGLAQGLRLPMIRDGSGRPHLQGCVLESQLFQQIIKHRYSGWRHSASQVCNAVSFVRFLQYRIDPKSPSFTYGQECRGRDRQVPAAANRVCE